MKILVTGAGGFIGHHLVRRLVRDGHELVAGVDMKHPEWTPTAAHVFSLADLRSARDATLALAHGFDRVYHLAANMGGIGFLEAHRAEVTRDNTLIDVNVLEAARICGAGRLLYSSSACVYPAHRQRTTDAPPLRESDAYPAAPEDGYGWQKLSTERLCRHYREDYGLDTRVARFHNIYGPEGTWTGGREKSPAAICRKVAMAEDGGTIDVWGDGEQTRSYCYVGDCIDGLVRLMESDHAAPLNIGRDDAVSVNGLVDLVCRVAGKRLSVRHDLSAPQGVRGRNADVTAMRAALGWTPATTMEVGMARTYEWIAAQVAA